MKQILNEGRLLLKMDDETSLAILTIDNSKMKNAFTWLMIENLTDAISQLEQWKKVIILS